MSLRLGDTILAGFSANARRIVKHIPSSEATNVVVLDKPCSSKSYIDLYINKIAQDPDYFELSDDGLNITLAETLDIGDEIVVKYWQSLPTSMLANDDEFVSRSDVKAPTCKQLSDNVAAMIAPNFDLDSMIEVTEPWSTTAKTYIMPVTGYIYTYYNEINNYVMFAAGDENNIIGIGGSLGGPLVFTPLLKKGTVVYYWSGSEVTSGAMFKVLKAQVIPA